MAGNKPIETRGHITGFREEIGRAAGTSRDSFFTWFDSAGDAEASFIRGQWDFTIHIAPHLARVVGNPECKTVLEIGYGGGRILAAASRAFAGAFGVDIHNRQDVVEAELKSRGLSNFKLLGGDGSHVPCEDASIDAIYSFIVLQHVERIAIWQSYLRECYRVLRPGGAAILYFGRWAPLSLNRARPWAYRLELLLESFFLPAGYRELPAVVNDTNLHVRLGYAKKYARETGFRILGTTVSRKRVPDGLRLFGSQHGLLLQK